MSALTEITNDAKGIAILNDWLGAGGKPVIRKLAEQRGVICVCCPHNSKAAFYDLIKTPVANAIKSHLEAKNQIGLKTESDADLFTCDLCRCCLPLKIWTPLEHIRAHTTDKQLNLLPEFCWQRKESYA